ncbi:hypothetical protein Tco_1254534 [Tanacetum coccineum]
MRKQQVLDLVLGGNQRVEFSRLFVLDGFQQERHSPLAQQRLKVNPQMVQMQISLTNVKANKLLMSVQAPFLNVQKTFDRSRSSLGLHGDDVCSHQFRPRSSSNDF